MAPSLNELYYWLNVLQISQSCLCKRAVLWKVFATQCCTNDQIVDSWHDMNVKVLCWCFVQCCMDCYGFSAFDWTLTAYILALTKLFLNEHWQHTYWQWHHCFTNRGTNSQSCFCRKKAIPYEVFRTRAMCTRLLIYIMRRNIRVLCWCFVKSFMHYQHAQCQDQGFKSFNHRLCYIIKYRSISRLLCKLMADDHNIWRCQTDLLKLTKIWLPSG